MYIAASISSLVHVITEVSLSDNKAGITFVKGEHKESFMSYPELYSSAIRILHHMQELGMKKGDEIVFQLEDNEKFIKVFWSCLLGGMIPVPVTVGNNFEHKRKLFKIWGILNRPWLIADTASAASLKLNSESGEWTDLMKEIDGQTFLFEQLEGESAGRGKIYEAQPDDIAFIQFSSGSTGDPKGVILTHKNLMANIDAIISCAGITVHDSVFSWMPLTHDMGLIGGHLVPLRRNIRQYSMPTSVFSRNPILWINKVNEHRATLLSSPNFGYQYLLKFMERKSSRGRRTPIDWDLSCVRLIFNGAEPISSQACKDFIDVMHQYGLKPNVIFPVYGMAEAGLAVTFPPPQEEMVTLHLDRSSLVTGRRVTTLESGDSANSVSFVDLGFQVDQCRYRICDEENLLLQDEEIGYIQISGNNVTGGYYNNKQATEKAFTPDGWLITGDLGFSRKGRLTVTGRAKDIIIVNGQNYYPHDIERVAGEALGSAMIETAAFSVYNHADQQEDIMLAVLFRKSIEDFIPVERKLINHINMMMGLEIKSIIPVKQIPKTTSGKVQRYKFAEWYGSGEYDQLIQDMEQRILRLESGRAIASPTTETEAAVLFLFKESLKKEQLGINDNFFEFGGTSLKAASLIAMIQKEFGVVLPIREIFLNPTVKGIAALLESAGDGEYLIIERVEEKENYELSSAQKRIYLLSQMEATGTSYNLPAVMKCTGTIHVERFEKAIAALVQRHDILRTSFELIEGLPMQRVHQDVVFQVGHIDLGRMDLDRTINDLVRPFDLGKAPLFRVSLIRCSDDEHVMLFDFHHIISDGVSMGILFQELMGLYNGSEPAPIQFQYKDFCAWQRRYAAGNEMKEAGAYWLQQYRSQPTVLELPTDYSRPSVQCFEGDSIRFQVEKPLTEQLQKTASQEGATLFMTLLAAFNVLLARYTGQTDIIVGSPVAGRRHAGLESMMGMFVNTLALRNWPEGEKTFRYFLNEVKENFINAYEHQDYPFEELVEHLAIQRDWSRNPLFDVVFAMQNMEWQQLQLDQLKIEAYPWKAGTSKFDISLFAALDNDVLEFELEYSTRLFRTSRIKAMVAHFIHVLKEVSANPDLPISLIEVIPEEERQLLTYGFNNTAVQYPLDKSIHMLISEQAAKTPENTAVCCNGLCLTYGELNTRAHRLASILKERGIGTNDIVGIMLEPSVDMIIGILSVLNTGAAFLPIDPGYPAERVRFMLEDSQAALLLSQSAIREKGVYTGDVLCDIMELTNQEQIKTRTISEGRSTDLAYVIYTSGTTGLPKGVMVEHRSLVNMCHWQVDTFRITEQDKSSKYAGFAFDASIFEIFPYLISGASVHIVPEEIRLDPEALNNFFHTNGITISFLPTQLCEQFIQLENRSLRILLTGGDKLRTYYPRSYQVMNCYGPTENTVVTTYHPVTEWSENISIGRPISNTQVYILDGQHRLQPIGVAGELCIAGASLARGYLKRPELTSEKFVPNPFEAGTRMYKTGDLARWKADGTIEYLGRIDQQVKIRGNRVEIGEIEDILLKHAAVADAAVMAMEDHHNQKFLVAYVVARSEIISELLREYMAKALPDYMVPAWIIPIDHIPLNQNGKIDRKALPEPELEAASVYVAPVSHIEQKLAKLWQEVLGAGQVGLNDHFFKMGGHSLSVAMLASKIHKEFGANMPISELFKAAYLHEQARWLETAEKSLGSVIKKAAEADYYKTSSAQRRLFILSQLKGAGINYNMPQILDISGELDIEKFSSAFQKLVERHEALRTSFELKAGEVVQKIHHDVTLEISRFTGAEGQALNEIDSFIRPFDLNKAPLVRVGLLTRPDGSSQVLFDMHHIVSDGLSVSILIKEFISLYKGEALPEISRQYKDYSEWQAEFLNGEELKKQETYWLEQFAGELPALQLPADYQRPSVYSFEGDSLKFGIDRVWTDKLKSFAVNEEATLYMALLSAFYVLLHKYSGQEDIIIGSPVAGRNHGELDRVVGMFVNTIAIRNKPLPDMTFRQLLEEVKKSSLEALENQDYPFEELVEKLDLQRDLSRNPLFDIMFSLQNMNKGLMEADGVAFIPRGFKSKTAKFDITLIAEEQEDQLGFELEFCTKLFNNQTMERLARHFIQIVESVITDPDARLSDISMLSEAEVTEILYDFNHTRTEYPNDRTIAGLFEEQVERNPGCIALVYGDEQLTYQELNERANSLAWLLKSQGVQPDTPVGLMTRRSMQMVIAMLAILKSGGAYVPVDPDYPLDRVHYLLEDSGARLLLTTPEFIHAARDGMELVDLSDVSVYQGNRANLSTENKPNDLAYIIYTSGSTGKPKGVLVEHINVIRLVKSTNYASFTEKDRMLQIGAPVFDATTYEIWGALLNGARLHLVDKEDIIDPDKFSRILAEHQITSMFITAALFNQMAVHNGAMFSSVSNLLVGGETLSAKHINLVRNHCKDQALCNIYGPTENTTFSIFFRIDNDYGENIPIGKPISNSTAYIVDKNGCLQPIGVPGELWVGGDGVARGYLNRPELTADKFIPSPFVEGERIYKTGDLARWLPDGNIEFLGRIDQQVKIRGYRIETDEIAAVIQSYDSISEAVVVTSEDASNEKFLSAYIVSDMNLEESDLREYLAKVLPIYMIPSFLMQVDKIPLTHNGKVNKVELLQMKGTSIRGNQYQPPSNPTEEKLAEIWCDILGISQVGIRDNFFEVGGHSLTATVLVSRIHKECNVEIGLKDVFSSPTIQEMAILIHSAKNNNNYRVIKPVAAAHVQGDQFYPVSSAQRRMFLMSKMEESSITYNIPVAMVVDGEISLKQMKNVFTQLIRRHESLRTSFHMVDGDCMQKIHDQIECDVAYSEDGDRELGDPERIRAAVESFVVPFELEKAPLFRVSLIKLDHMKHVMLFDIHHIVADGVSMDILTKEFIALYTGQELSPPDIHYKDFVAWQHEALESGMISRQEKYWKDLFQGEIPVLNMPTTYPRPSRRSFRGDTLEFKLGGSLFGKLSELASKQGVTMYMLLLASFNVVLTKYTGQEDIVVGSPVAGRRHADLQSMIGMFVNTLSMRNAPAGNKTFAHFLEEVRENTLNAYENQDYQFEELVANLDLQRDLSRNPLFDVMFSLHSFGEDVFQAGGLTFTNFGIDNQISKFDLSLDAIHGDSHITCNVEYAVDLYSREMVERFIQHFIHALVQVTEHPDKQISEIEIMSGDEKTSILVGFNDTKLDYEKTKTLHQLFEERVQKQPDYPAVHFEGETLTYAELNSRANQLARRLRELGLQAGEMVPIMCERSIDMIVGILSVLKAGGAYLPIDPYYPVDRIVFMFEDSQARMLLTHSRYVNGIGFNGKLLLLDDKEWFNGDEGDLVNVTKPEDLAYVIYTSGSTGKPKGVMVEHRSVINLATWLSGMLALEGKRFLHMSNVSFDNSVEEIFPQLISGATVYMLSKEDSLDRNTFTSFVNKNQIQIVNLLPMTMKELLAGQGRIECLKHVMVGGDKLEESLKDQILSLGYTLTDHYGPTESTVDAIYTRCEANKAVIGKPISNTRVYIVDSYDKPVPVGVAGEICIAGDGLARGYLNRPELTCEKFVPNPFEEGQRMYRTGDLAYWTAEGETVYLGRVDNQVKIRGFRIELGEIEKQLLAHESVQNVIVMDRTDNQGRKYLCGYIVSGQELSISELRTHLLKVLPDYMIPAAFVILDRLPQTPNGKIDRKALPEPVESFSAGTTYVSPRNETEHTLVQIWAEVLSVPVQKIGIHDSFFDLGGNSIMIMQLTNLINDRFDTQCVRVTDLFNYTTVDEIAVHINSQLNKTEADQEEIIKFTF